MKKLFIGLVVVIVLIIGYFGYQKIFNKKFHIHADFAVFINGEKLDFSSEKYMTSTDTCSVDYNSKHTHLHNENGGVLHVHERGQTVMDFAHSLGFLVSDEAITTDKEIVYKNNDALKWRLFVNGIEQSSLNYEIKDLDQILISYASSTISDFSKEFEQITSQACIYSEKCPKPSDIVLPTELCGSSE